MLKEPRKTPTHPACPFAFLLPRSCRADLRRRASRRKFLVPRVLVAAHPAPVFSPTLTSRRDRKATDRTPHPFHACPNRATHTTPAVCVRSSSDPRCLQRKPSPSSAETHLHHERRTAHTTSLFFVVVNSRHRKPKVSTTIASSQRSPTSFSPDEERAQQGHTQHKLCCHHHPLI